jgi:alkylation response protein AidB-like acyl-CoA dehydrogenase
MSGYLERERDTCERLLPGLDKQLAGYSLAELERPGGPAIGLFKELGGAGLCVPAVHHGAGAGAADTVQVLRAVGARSPSLAIGTTMHHFSVASLVALAEHSQGFEWLLLEGVADDRRLMASGFSEGRTGQGILSPTMRVRTDEESGGWLVSGQKKPCSLSRSMDLLTASVALPDGRGGTELGVALIPAASPGLRVEPFWASPALAAAESDAVILDDVLVHPDLMIRPELGLSGELDDLQTFGFIWFELLVAASYLGVASALVETCLRRGRGTATQRSDLATRTEGAALAIEAVATALDDGDRGNDALARSLVARFVTGSIVNDVVAGAVELLGGMAFISSGDVAVLAAASHAIGFHPPSRAAAAEPLGAWFAGDPLVLT